MHEIKCFVFSGMRLQISHIGESHIIFAFCWSCSTKSNNGFSKPRSAIKGKHFCSIFNCIAINLCKRFLCITFVVMEKGLNFTIIYEFHNFHHAVVSFTLMTLLLSSPASSFLVVIEGKFSWLLIFLFLFNFKNWPLRQNHIFMFFSIFT